MVCCVNTPALQHTHCSGPPATLLFGRSRWISWHTHPQFIPQAAHTNSPDVSAAGAVNREELLLQLSCWPGFNLAGVEKCGVCIVVEITCNYCLPCNVGRQHVFYFLTDSLRDWCPNVDLYVLDSGWIPCCAYSVHYRSCDVRLGITYRMRLTRRWSNTII